jgi:hypothetical protein
MNASALQFKLMLCAAKTILWRELLLLLPRRRCAFARFNWVALLLVLYGDKGREREFDAVK